MPQNGQADAQTVGAGGRALFGIEMTGLMAAYEMAANKAHEAQPEPGPVDGANEAVVRQQIAAGVARHSDQPPQNEFRPGIGVAVGLGAALFGAADFSKYFISFVR